MTWDRALRRRRREVLDGLDQRSERPVLAEHRGFQPAECIHAARIAYARRDVGLDLGDLLLEMLKIHRRQHGTRNGFGFKEEQPWSGQRATPLRKDLACASIIIRPEEIGDSHASETDL